MPEDAKVFLDEHYRSPDEQLTELLGREPFWVRQNR